MKRDIVSIIYDVCVVPDTKAKLAFQVTFFVSVAVFMLFVSLDSDRSHLILISPLFFFQAFLQVSKHMKICRNRSQDMDR